MSYRNDFGYTFKTLPDKDIEELILSHTGLVYTIVYSKLHTSFSKEDIEECVSDVFLEALKKNKNLMNSEKGTVKSYLAIIAKRRAIDFYRRLAKTRANIPIDEVIEICDSTSTENRVIQKEDRKALLTEIKSLGEPDSEIFIRKFYFEQSGKEISVALNIKENTINKKVSRGIEKLKKILAGEIHGKQNKIINEPIDTR